MNNTVEELKELTSSVPRDSCFVTDDTTSLITASLGYKVLVIPYPPYYGKNYENLIAMRNKLLGLKDLEEQNAQKIYANCNYLILRKGIQPEIPSDYYTIFETINYRLIKHAKYSKSSKNNPTQLSFSSSTPR